MARVLQPWQILVAAMAGWITRQQDEENRVLKEQLDGRRLHLTDDQRRRLAAKGKAIGRRALAEVGFTGRSLSVRQAERGEDVELVPVP